MKKKIIKEEKKRKISLRFASILAIVSIIGFFDIMSFSFFNFSLGNYQEVLWFVLLGIGFILEAHPESISKKPKDDSITNITSLVIGSISIIAGILTIPFIGMDHIVFSATKGVISLIAIIFIALETWVMKN